jgi:NTE family protein
LVEAVFDDTPRRSALIFAVHMWGPNGPEPDTIWTVMSRQKDLQYANPAVSHIRRQKQIHELRHIIAELAQKLPAEMRAEPDIAAMADLGRITRMHVVRLLAPPLAGEDRWTSFSLPLRKIIESAQPFSSKMHSHFHESAFLDRLQ